MAVPMAVLVNPDVAKAIYHFIEKIFKKLIFKILKAVNFDIAGAALQLIVTNDNGIKH